VVQVTENGRAARRRSKAQVGAAQNAVETTVKTLVSVRDHFAPGADRRQSARALCDIGLFDDMLAQLDAIPLHDVEDSKVVDAVVATKVALRSARRDCAAVAAGQVPGHEEFVEFAIERLMVFAQHLDVAVRRLGTT